MTFIIRNTGEKDIPGIQELCRRVYTASPSWNREQLQNHLRLFPEGQLVAIEQASGKVIGMAASLIVRWDDYEMSDPWRDFTDRGYFTNHDPVDGKTLYGAEVMTDPDWRGQGVGKALYRARREITRKFGLLRIRAGARLAGYYRYADKLTPKEYVREIIAGRIQDPTLGFQMKEGFKVIGMAPDYLHHDPESGGHAAVIEWLNAMADKTKPPRPRTEQKIPLSRILEQIAERAS